MTSGNGVGAHGALGTAEEAPAGGHGGLLGRADSELAQLRSRMAAAMAALHGEVVAEAAAVLEEARVEAVRVREQADVDAVRVRIEADAAAAEVVAEAERRARALVAEAERHRDEILLQAREETRRLGEQVVARPATAASSPDDVVARMTRLLPQLEQLVVSGMPDAPSAPRPEVPPVHHGPAAPPEPIIGSRGRQGSPGQDDPPEDGTGPGGAAIDPTAPRRPPEHRSRRPWTR